MPVIHSPQNSKEINKPTIAISHSHIINLYNNRIFPPDSSSFLPCFSSPFQPSKWLPSWASPAQLPPGSHLSNKMDIFLSKMFLQGLCNNHPLESCLSRDMCMTFRRPLDMLFRRNEHCRWVRKLGVGEICCLTLWWIRLAASDKYLQWGRWDGLRMWVYLLCSTR